MEGRHYLSALLLLHSRVPASLEGELLYGSHAPVFTFGALVFRHATQGIPLDHLALVARSLAFLGPIGQ